MKRSSNRHLAEVRAVEAEDRTQGRESTFDEELRAAVNQGLPIDVTVRDVSRRMSDYASSFHIEEVDAELSDGRHLQLVFKALGQRAMLDAARCHRPAGLHDPRREIEVYRCALAQHDELGTARFHAGVIEEAKNRYWLFNERVDGELLWQRGDFEVWLQTARWLAFMHASLGLPSSSQRRQMHLRSCDTNEFFAALRRFSGRAAEDDPATNQLADELQHAGDRYASRLAALPQSLIHGDFFPANIIVTGNSDSPRICTVDWEMAAVGPSLLDLAALTSGHWSEQDRRLIATAYFEALPDGGAAYGGLHAGLNSLEVCRIYLAAYCLGWPREWEPPPEQANDWVDEARGAMARLAA